MNQRIAVLVDGDNLSAAHAPELRRIGAALGLPAVLRVYGDFSRLPGWQAVPGFRHVHAGSGKNATDLLLTVDAMELALEAEVEALVLASSDGDFSHLALRLRERGLQIVGAGEAKAPPHFREACGHFIELGSVATPRIETHCARDRTLAPTAEVTDALTPCPGKIDRQIRHLIQQHGNRDHGMPIARLGQYLKQTYGLLTSELPETNWRAYLEARANLYLLDPRGPDAHVRFRPEGFTVS